MVLFFSFVGDILESYFKRLSNLKIPVSLFLAMVVFWIGLMALSVLYNKNKISDLGKMNINVFSLELQLE